MVSQRWAAGWEEEPFDIGAMCFLDELTQETLLSTDACPPSFQNQGFRQLSAQGGTHQTHS